MEDYQKVRVLARIRQSNISETYSATLQQQQALVNSSGGTPSQLNIIPETASIASSSTKPQQQQQPKSILANSQIAAYSSLDRDQKICIFTASGSHRNPEKPTLVAASGNPIKRQLLNDYVKSDKNITQYRHSILENANIFKFDHAMGPKINNHHVYSDECADLVKKAVASGISSTFIVVGPPKAGKKYTVKGGEQTNEKGILSRAVDHLIDLSKLQSEGAGTKITKSNKPLTILFSIFAIYNNEIVDLITNDSNSSEYEEELTEFELTFSGDYRKHFMKSRERLKMIGGSGDSSAQRKLHIIYRFSIYRNDQASMKRSFNAPNTGLRSTLNFVHCADFSKSKMPEFAILGDYLTDIATRKDQNLLEVPAYANSKLISSLNDSLNTGSDNQCVLICNVSGSYDYLTSSVDALQVRYYLNNSILLFIHQDYQINWWQFKYIYLMKQYSAGIKERIDNFFEDIREYSNESGGEINPNLIQTLTSPSAKSTLKTSTNNYFEDERGRDGTRGNSGFDSSSSLQNDRSKRQPDRYNQNGELIHIENRRDTKNWFERQRGRNPSAREIDSDLNQLLKTIFDFSEQTAGYQPDEIDEWVAQHEKHLKNIVEDIQDLSPQEIKYFQEEAAMKIEEAFNFLNQLKAGSNDDSQLKNQQPYLSQQSLTHGQSQNNIPSTNSFVGFNSFPNNPSPLQQEIPQNEQNRSNLQDNLKEEDIAKLLNMYSRERDQNSRGGDQAGLSKRNLKALREDILNKIEDIISENDMARVQDQIGSQVGNNNSILQAITEKANKSLNSLRQLLEEQERLFAQKKSRLKKENKELRETGVELKNEITYLQGEQRSNQAMIDFLDSENIHLKAEAQRDSEIIQLKLNKEALLEKNEEEYKDLIHRMKLKLNRRKEQALVLKEKLGKTERALDNELAERESDRRLFNTEIDDKVLRLDQERQKLNEKNIESELLREQNLNLMNLIEDLKAINARNQQIQQQLQEEQQVNRQILDKQNLLEESERNLIEKNQVLEDKLLRLKLKSAEDKKVYIDEADNEAKKRKEANSTLKASVKDLERLLSEANQTIKIFKNEREDFIGQAQKSQELAAESNQKALSLQKQVDILNNELKRQKNLQKEISSISLLEQTQSKSLQSELERHIQAQKESNAAILSMEAQIKQLSEEKDLLVSENSALDSENRTLQQNLLNEQQQQVFQSDQTQSELQKYEAAYEQLRIIFSEKEKTLSYLQLELDQCSHERDRYKHSSEQQQRKLNENRNIILQLTQQLDAMDAKVSEIIHQRNSESKAQHSEFISRSHQKQQQQQQQQQQTQILSKENPENEGRHQSSHKSILKKPAINVAYSSESELSSDEEYS